MMTTIAEKLPATTKSAVPQERLPADTTVDEIDLAWLNDRARTHRLRALTEADGFDESMATVTLEQAAEVDPKDAVVVVAVAFELIDGVGVVRGRQLLRVHHAWLDSNTGWSRARTGGDGNLEWLGDAEVITCLLRHPDWLVIASSRCTGWEK